jgi:hypothetical protein
LRADAGREHPRVARTNPRSPRVPGNKVGSGDWRAKASRRGMRLPAAEWLIATSIVAGALLQLDGVALHLIVKRGALDAEKFCGLFLVSMAFGQRLNNSGSFDIVEALHARAR